MTKGDSVEAFLSGYDETVFSNGLKLRKIILANLPAITEQVDRSARMIAYCYGQKYAEMICTMIPSKKGLKIGFYKGNELPDPSGILKGEGKISRYVEIKSDSEIKSAALKSLLKNGLKAYQVRMKGK